MRGKRIIKSAVCVIMSLSVLIGVLLASIPVSAYYAGDMNADGVVTSVDAMIMIFNILEQQVSPFERQMADLNGDGSVTSVDANMLVKLILGDSTEIKESQIDSLNLGGVDLSKYSLLLPSSYPKDASEKNARYSAQIIQKYIKEATGYEIPVITEKSGNVIEMRYDEELGLEAFRIEVSEGKVTLSGGVLRGLLYGAYGFLEEIFGYRFIGNDIHTLKTVGKRSFDVGYTHTEGLTTPFLYRDAYTNSQSGNFSSKGYRGAFECVYRESNIAAHNTGIWDGDYSWKTSGKYGYSYGPDRNHSMHALAPNSLTDNGNFCFSSGDVLNGSVCSTKGLDETVANIRTYLKGMDAKGMTGSKRPMISISQNDSTSQCTCRFCSKTRRDYGSDAAIVTKFIERVHDALKDDYPDVKFWTLVYCYTSKPPVNLELPDYIYYCFCLYPQCNNHKLDGSECVKVNNSVSNEVSYKYLCEWLKLTPNVHVWYYTCQFYYSVVTMPILHRLYTDIRELADLGVCGIFFENEETTLSTSGLIAYITSELMWDETITEDEYYEMIREYCICRFGDGGDGIYDYLMMLEEATARSGCWCGLGDAPKYIYDMDYIADNFTASLENFEKAYAKAESDTEKAAIDRLWCQMAFIGLTASHDRMVTNGDSASREKYGEIYTRMYNILKGYQSEKSLKFSHFENACLATIPETCDPLCDPFTWYNKEIHVTSFNW